MKKVTKYLLGAGALFGLGFGTCYVLTGDVQGLWNKTKYVYCKTQRAMLEYEEKINDIKPGPIKKIDEVIINNWPGTNVEDQKQRIQEAKDLLDEKIEKCEQEKK